MTHKSQLIRAMVIAIGLAIPGVYAPAPAAAEPIAAGLPSTPSGLARVWLLRQFEPNESLRTPMIFVNGAPLASSMPGTMFYRDLAPGTYTFSVETCTVDTKQATTLSLPPGSETNLEVQSLASFRSWGCLAHDTFYV